MNCMQRKETEREEGVEIVSGIGGWLHMHEGTGILRGKKGTSSRLQRAWARSGNHSRGHDAVVPAQRRRGKEVLRYTHAVRSEIWDCHFRQD